MNKTFGQLSEGTRFSLNNNVYIKIREVKITCCKTVNAHLASDPNNRTYIRPETTVIING